MDIKVMNQLNLMTKKKYEALIQYKKEYIENGVTPLGRPDIRDEIAASWIRCHSSGLKPSDNIRFSSTKCTKQNHLDLIEIAEPLMTAFSQLVAMIAFSELKAVPNYGIYLFDEENLMLLHVGNNQLTSAPITDGEVMTGIGEEKYYGTSAHILSLNCRKPIQIIGSEHYLDCLGGNIASAAPIVVGDGEIFGILVFVLENQDCLWSNETHILQASALEWISSLAIAVSHRIKLRKDHLLLQASWDFMDEGMLTVNIDGKIINVNKQVSLILKKSVEEICGTSLAFYMRDPGFINKVLSGENFNYVEDVILTPSGERNYLFSSRSAYGNNNKNIGAVVRISNINKLHQFVASQSSHIVRFTFDDIIDDCEVMKNAKKLAQLFSHTNENVLLTGESGTGKEMFAQSIHNESRPRGPFIALNCAALPRNLVEAELFGYEGGSFTGADRKGRIGKIELAKGGTLFLDEIGDMPSDIQAIFLRVLEDKTVMRIGGSSYKPVDFRLIAATNRDLMTLVKAGQFRADLYYRLSSLTVYIPPLRERGNDILILAEHLIKQYCKKANIPILSIDSEAQKALMSYSWPGNVRELEKTIGYAIITSQDGKISVKNLPENIRNTLTSNKKEIISEDTFPESFMTLEETERQQINKALERCDNNVIKAAALLGISKSALYSKLKKEKIY